MAVSITSDMTLISNCDATTGWSGGAVNATFQLEGSNCLGVKVSNNTSSVYSYTFGSNQDMTDKFVIMTMLVTGQTDIKANGGYRIYVEDSSGNNGTWYVGGSDTHSGGWGYFAVDPSTTPTAGSGTINVASIAKVGVQMKTVTTALGNASNIFWDICHFGSKMTATSLTTDEATWEDFATYSESNYYGLVQKVEGVYFVRGGFEFGATSTSHINFVDAGSTVVWRDDTFVPSSAAYIKPLSSSTTTTNVTIQNGVLKGSGTQPTIDATDTNVDDFTLDTMLIQNFASIDLEDNATMNSCIIDSSEPVDLLDGTISGSTFSNTLADQYSNEGAIIVSDAASAALVTGASFASYSNADQRYNSPAVVIPAAVTSLTMSNWQFDDPNNTTGYAVRWLGTSGTLTISATNGTNITQTGCTVNPPNIDSTDTDPFGGSELIALYEFENDVTDSLSAHNGTASNVTYTTGTLGTYEAVFNGTSSSVSLANFGSVAIGDIRAISFWLNPDAMAGHVFTIGQSGDTYDWFRIYLGTSNVNAAFYDSAGSIAKIVYSATNSISTSGPYHVLITLPASDSMDDFAIYVNGSYSQLTENNYSSIASAGGSVYIGRSCIAAAPNWYDGNVDQFMIWDTLPTASQIWEIYKIADNPATTATISVSQDVTVEVTDVVVGSSVHVATLDGNGDESTVLINEVASTSTVSTSTNYAGLDYTSVIIKVRNSSGTPKYLPFKTTGTISSSGLSVAANQVEDTIAQ